MEAQLRQAQSMIETQDLENLQHAVEVLKAIVSAPVDDFDHPSQNETEGAPCPSIQSKASHFIKSEAIYSLTKIYIQQDAPEQVLQLMRSLRPYLTLLPAVKTARIVRFVVDLLSEAPKAEDILIEACIEYITWSDEEKRIFLRQRLQFRLAQVYLKVRRFADALEVLSKLIKEVKHLDDKPLMVEAYLLESKIYYGMLNVAKARSSLTLARSAANAIYCPPSLQAGLDALSGAMLCEEHDYLLAFSYFYEGYDNYSRSIKDGTARIARAGRSMTPEHLQINTVATFPPLESPIATSTQDEPTYTSSQVLDRQIAYKKADIAGANECLKSMLLCKIMSNAPSEVSALISGRFALDYEQPEFSAMRNIAKAFMNASVKDFNEAITKHHDDIAADSLVSRHLSLLYNRLFEQNLLRLVVPFSHVQISYLASLIELDPNVIERKISQMILDNKLQGILNQGGSSLILFDEPEPDTTPKLVSDTISEINKVVYNLYNRALHLA